MIINGRKLTAEEINDWFARAHMPPRAGKAPPPMIARLGNALYALGCLLAVAMFAFEAAIEVWTVQPGETDGFSRWMAATLVALVFWLIGRACRYVLAGR